MVFRNSSEKWTKSINRQGVKLNSMQAILEQNTIAQSVINRTNEVFGSRIGLIGSLFGCWHKQLTRPFTIGNYSYRACLDCGARKQFDTQNLRTIGSFHYPPILSFDENIGNN